MQPQGSIPMIVLALALAGCGGRNTGEPAPEGGRGTTATAADWQGQKVGQVEELMAGRFAGVQLLRTPDGLVVRIRGVSSVNSSNEPLYVLDGMTIQPGPGGALIGINPADIEKIEVLKDIGSTAIYGVQGANGVVLITTKRAKR